MHIIRNDKGILQINNHFLLAELTNKIDFELKSFLSKYHLFS